jgi:hypothetical protein
MCFFSSSNLDISTHELVAATNSNNSTKIKALEKKQKVKIMKQIKISNIPIIIKK